MRHKRHCLLEFIPQAKKLIYSIGLDNDIWYGEIALHVVLHRFVFFKLGMVPGDVVVGVHF